MEGRKVIEEAVENFYFYFFTFSHSQLTKLIFSFFVDFLSNIFFSFFFFFNREKVTVKKKMVERRKIFYYEIPEKLFQKYYQYLLKEKSIIISHRSDLIPDDLKPFQIPVSIKEKYETDVFGLSKITNNIHPPNNKNYTNNPCSY